MHNLEQHEEPTALFFLIHFIIYAFPKFAAQFNFMFRRAFTQLTRQFMATYTIRVDRKRKYCEIQRRP